MLHIIDVRRERVLAAAEFPNGLKNSFNHMERAGNPGASRPMSDSFGLRFAFPGADDRAKFRSGCALLGWLCGGV